MVYKFLEAEISVANKMDRHEAKVYHTDFHFLAHEWAQCKEKRVGGDTWEVWGVPVA